MDINEMTLTDVNERLSALEIEVRDSQDREAVEKACEEKTALLERKKELEELETRTAQAQALTEEIIPEESITIKEERKENTEMGKAFTVESPEYRSAYLKNLQGKALDEVEARAIAQAGADGAIPTLTGNKFFEKLKKLAPMVGEISLFQVAGNIKFMVEGTRDAASKHTENADITAGQNDAFITVELGAFEFAKVIGISKSVASMAIDAFEDWLVGYLSGDIARLVDDYIINDVNNGLTACTSIVSTKINATSYSYENILKLIGDLPAAYDAEAKFLMNKATLYGQVAAIKGSDGQPIFVQNAADGIARIMGYPVLVDDYITSAKAPIFLGKFSEIVGNFSIPLEVEKSEHAGFTKGTIMYRGFAAFDSKVANPDGIVKMYQS